MSLSEIKKRLVQAFESGKQEFLEKLQQIPSSSEIKEQLVQAFFEDLERIKTDIKEIITMSLPTKITMLGTTGTGKTCYMIGMSIWMQQKGTKGFTITSVNHDQYNKIKEQWSAMRNKQGAERWPAGTVDVPIEYSFNFNYSGITFAEFDWLDYRGAALPGPEDVADRKILVERLLTSDCILLCISAEHLALAAIDYDEALEAAEVGTINGLLTEVAQKARPTAENPVPVAIVITKADLLAQVQGKMPGNPVEIAKGFFENTLFVEPKWLTAIIPVTLGQELAQNPDSGRIKAEGVHIPVSFGVLCKLIKQKRGQAASRSWKDIIRLITGQETDIDTQIKKLDEELASIPIYAGSQKITSLLNWAK